MLSYANLRAFAFCLAFIAPSVSLAESVAMPFGKLQLDEISAIEITSLIAIIGYELNQSSVDLSYNPLSKNVSFSLRF